MERTRRKIGRTVLILVIGLIFWSIPASSQSDTTVVRTRPIRSWIYVDFSFGYLPTNKILLCDLNAGYRFNKHHAVGTSLSFLGRKANIGIPGIVFNPNTNCILWGLQHRYTPFRRWLLRLEGGFVTNAFVTPAIGDVYEYTHLPKFSSRLYGRIGITYRFKSDFGLSLVYTHLDHLAFKVNTRPYIPYQDLGSFSLSRFGGICLQFGFILPGYY